MGIDSFIVERFNAKRLPKFIHKPPYVHRVARRAMEVGYLEAMRARREQPGPIANDFCDLEKLKTGRNNEDPAGNGVFGFTNVSDGAGVLGASSSGAGVVGTGERGVSGTGRFGVVGIGSTLGVWGRSHRFETGHGKDAIELLNFGADAFAIADEKDIHRRAGRLGAEAQEQRPPGSGADPEIGIRCCLPSNIDGIYHLRVKPCVRFERIGTACGNRNRKRL
jgi:hypothetical protein